MDKATLDEIVQKYREELARGPYTQRLADKLVYSLRQTLYRTYAIKEEAPDARN